MTLPAHTQPLDSPADAHAARDGESPIELFQVHAIIHQAQAAFRLALPGLWQERPGQWVAYHGDQQLGFATTKSALYTECIARGWRRGEFLVRCIEPESDAIFVGPRPLD